MGVGVKWYLLKEKKSRGGALFDRSTKPNIQCTVSVYQKCHFQSTLWTTVPVKVFISAYSANSDNYANNTYILSRNQQSVQFKVQYSHLFIVLQLQLELPASPQSPLPPTLPVLYTCSPVLSVWMSQRASITAMRASNTGSPRLSCPCRPRPQFLM